MSESVHDISDKSKKMIMFSLITLSIILTFLFVFVLQIEIVYTHFFYIPTILACFWWKKNGIGIPIFLSIIEISFPLLAGIDLFILDNIIRAISLICIGSVVGFLSFRISLAEYKLKGRVRELNCLYGINKAINNPNNSVDEIISGTLDRIRCAWKYPHLACAKITFDNREYKTKNYKTTPWKISEDVSIGDKTLLIDIHYLEDLRFREEENILLREILDQLRAIFELKLAWIK